MKQNANVNISQGIRAVEINGINNKISNNIERYIGPSCETEREGGRERRFKSGNNNHVQAKT